MGENLRSGGVIKKKSSSGCLIIKKKAFDGVGSSGGGVFGLGIGSSRVSHKEKMRPRSMPSDSESSDGLLAPASRKAGHTFRNGSVVYSCNGFEDTEFTGNDESANGRKRIRLGSFDHDNCRKFEGNQMKDHYVGDRLQMARRSGCSGENAVIERRNSNTAGSGTLFIGMSEDMDTRGNSRYNLNDHEAHIPTSLLGLKFHEANKPIRVQGKNGVLKVMMNKNKKMGMLHRNYHYQGYKLEDFTTKDIYVQPSSCSGYGQPENQISAVKKERGELKFKSPFLAKTSRSSFLEADGTDTSLKLAPPSMQNRCLMKEIEKEEKLSSSTGLNSRSVLIMNPLKVVKEEGRRSSSPTSLPVGSSLKAIMKEEKRSCPAELAPLGQQIESSATGVKAEEKDLSPAENVILAKAQEGKLKRGGSTEKQQLREKIREMLTKSGWTIDYRPRRNRDYLDAVYINPSGTAYWSIIKAYEALQKQLVQEDDNYKPEGVSCPFVPLSEDLIGKLTRQTRKKMEKQMKKKRIEEGVVKLPKEMKESTKRMDGHQHNERLLRDMEHSPKLREGKLQARDHSTGEDSSRHSSKGKLHQDLTGKEFVADGSGAIHLRKSGNVRCTLLIRNTNKVQDSETDGYIPYTGKRTLLAWLIDSGTVTLSAKVQYMNRRRTRVKLEGWITRDGIHCGCCSKVLPVLKFELHAGSKLRQPYQNIYLESGVSLLECQIDAWNRQKESERKDFHVIDLEGDDPDDDTCGICGDGGDLICCDGCPSTFHQSCLSIQMLPPGDWHCPNCTCKFCGMADATVDDGDGDGDGDGDVDELLQCIHCDKKYHKTCIQDMDVVLMNSSEVSAYFCEEKCKEIYSHLQKIVGVKNDLEAGFSWSLVQRTDLDFDMLNLASAQRAECNSKLAVALSVMNECFKPIVDRRSGLNLIHNVLYNCGSNFSRLNFRGFYTAILERGDEIISAASIRIRGTQLAEMPFIGTRYIYRRQGMCHRLFSAIESVLSSLNVEKLIVPAIPEHINTWTTVFGFSTLNESQKQDIRSMNMLVFPGIDMLQKMLVKHDMPNGAHTVEPTLSALVEKPDMDSSGRHSSNDCVDTTVLTTNKNQANDDRTDSGSPVSAFPSNDSATMDASYNSDTGLSSKRTKLLDPSHSGNGTMVG